MSGLRIPESLLLLTDRMHENALKKKWSIVRANIDAEEERLEMNEALQERLSHEMEEWKE